MKGSKTVLFLALVLTLSLLGCAQRTPTAAPPATLQPQAAPATQAAAPTAASAGAEEPILIAFAYVGPVSDEGWTWTHDQARLELEKAFPGKIRTAFVESMPYSDEASRAIEQFVADGAKMIFINSEYADFVTKVAEEYPDVVFLECDGHRVAQNEMWYYVEHWNPTYLIGMAAGLLTKTNKLGYVGSYPVQSVYASANSFQLGAQSVNPEVTTRVVLIDSWFDPGKANQAATALIDDGADFIMDIMDEPSVLQVAAKRGVWSATWNTDMRRFGPTAYVSSVSLDWKDFYKTELQSFLDGAWKGNQGILLPLGKGVDRDAWGENVPTDVQEKVDAVRAKMLNEGFSPFVGPIKDATGQVRVPEGKQLTPDELYTWDWAVEGVAGLP